MQRIVIRLHQIDALSITDRGARNIGRERIEAVQGGVKRGAQASNNDESQKQGRKSTVTTRENSADNPPVTSFHACSHSFRFALFPVLQHETTRTEEALRNQARSRAGLRTCRRMRCWSVPKSGRSSL